MASNGAILQVQNAIAGYGRVEVLRGVSIDVEEQNVVAIIGPNGAGKSTLFNTIVGLYAPDAGTVYFAGKRVDGLQPYDLVRLGLVKTFQIPRELRNLTVLENLLLSAKQVPGESLVKFLLRYSAGRRREREIQAKAEDLLEFIGLYSLRDEYAKNLSGGQKKLLELTRALMSDPSLILLDEPVAGVNPTLAGRILDLVGKLRDQGRTIFLIEHDMDVVMNRCDWIVVLHQGKRLTEGVAAEVKSDQGVIEAYLGA